MCSAGMVPLANCGRPTNLFYLPRRGVCEWGISCFGPTGGRYPKSLEECEQKCLSKPACSSEYWTSANLMNTNRIMIDDNPLSTQLELINPLWSFWFERYPSTVWCRCVYWRYRTSSGGKWRNRSRWSRLANIIFNPMHHVKVLTNKNC